MEYGSKIINKYKTIDESHIISSNPHGQYSKPIMYLSNQSQWTSGKIISLGKFDSTTDKVNIFLELLILPDEEMSDLSLNGKLNLMITKDLNSDVYVEMEYENISSKFIGLFDLFYLVQNIDGNIYSFDLYFRNTTTIKNKIIVLNSYVTTDYTVKNKVCFSPVNSKIVYYYSPTYVSDINNILNSNSILISTSKWKNEIVRYLSKPSITSILKNKKIIIGEKIYTCQLDTDGVYKLIPILLGSQSLTTGTTQNVDEITNLILNHGSPTNFTGFSGGYNGQIITILAVSGNTTLVSGGAFVLKGLVNVTLSTNNIVTFKNFNNSWREISRNF